MDKDTIYRQQAIDALIEYGSGNSIYMSVGELKRRIEALPSAQPERKRGKWICIDNGDGFPDWLCSECGNSGRGDYSYCPWCNADMREGQDG